MVTTLCCYSYNIAIGQLQNTMKELRKVVDDKEQVSLLCIVCVENFKIKILCNFSDEFHILYKCSARNNSRPLAIF